MAKKKIHQKYHVTNWKYMLIECIMQRAIRIK